MMKIAALLYAMKKGAEVADPALWKNRQITGTALGGFIMALLNVLSAYGIGLPIDGDMANGIGAAILSVYNIVLTLATSRKVGVGDAGQ